ncbi:hypothetical protein IMZ48_00610 [Candidatus Bathyarchaeota archaeon]|nr:hypothetical protein [Candidatus Bathyarchaeota archaeon]
MDEPGGQEPDGDDPVEDELEYDGYTDTDSECGATLGDNDFRLRQLRTNRFTTSQEITQYWHLSPHASFELQLLQSAEPVEWIGSSAVDGAAPDEFSLAMQDVAEVCHHPGSLLVRVYLCSTDEAVMVSFWRERTKRRLIGLCGRWGKEVRGEE